MVILSLYPSLSYLLYSLDVEPFYAGLDYTKTKQKKKGQPLWVRKDGKRNNLSVHTSLSTDIYKHLWFAIPFLNPQMLCRTHSCIRKTKTTAACIKRDGIRNDAVQCTFFFFQNLKFFLLVEFVSRDFFF